MIGLLKKKNPNVIIVEPLFKIKKGDTVLLKCDRRLTPEEIHHVSKALNGFKEAEDLKIIAIDNDFTAEKIEKMPCVSCDCPSQTSTPDDADMCWKCFGEFNATNYENLKKKFTALLQRDYPDADIEDALDECRPLPEPVKKWQPIDTAPMDTNILVRWPMRKLDENDMPTGEITSISTVIACRRKDFWDDFGVMEETCAGYRCEDDETAFEPIEWTPIPSGYREVE